MSTTKTKVKVVTPTITSIEIKSCRICCGKKNLCPLFKYKLSGNYAEMLTAVADVKVAANDGLPNKICAKCGTTLEKAYLLKTVAERTDKKLRARLHSIEANIPKKKIAFDSFTDIKSEIGPLNVKPEPKWEMEIEVLNPNVPLSTTDNKDIVIANTVIRKVDGSGESKGDILANENTDADVSWSKVKKDPSEDIEFLDDFFQDADSDDDYVPPDEKPKKSKFKKPETQKLKVLSLKDKKATVIKQVRVINKMGLKVSKAKNINKDGTTSLITCYPVNKNGTKGSPILLKRPKDATVLKVDPNYKVKKPVVLQSSRVTIRDKPIRVVRTNKTTVIKPREKLVCPVCGILTFTLGNHMSTHQEKKRYTCAHCPKTFAQRGNMLSHMKQHTGIKDHICEICGAGFYYQKGLLRHNLIHKGERPFGCSLCPKRFIARCDLNRHLRIHSGYKPYKCSTCTMSFNAKHQLQNHERMHTGERPYACQVTRHDSLLQKELLNRHFKIHRDKQHKCDICDKEFTRKDNLAEHTRTHTGDRPFTCKICNVAFSYKVNLNNHVMKVHGINLKFKSIHTVTEEVLRREMEMTGEARIAITHMMSDVPPPAAHETIM